MRDWKDSTIGEAVDFTSKPRGLVYSDLVEIPFVPMDLVPVGNTYIQNHVLKPGKQIRSGNYFENGDCLIAKITPCFENGKQGIVRDLPADFGVASTELIPFRGRKGLSNKFFLFYFFLEATTRSQIAQKMEGATGRQRIPISVLKDWPISLPPLPEQEKIAVVLLKIQLAVETEEKIIQSLRDLKKSTMHHLFTHGLRGEKTKMTEIGEIPKSWKVATCEDVADKITVGIVVRPASYYVRDGVPAFRSLNVREDRLVPDDLVYISQADNDGKLVKSKLRVGDILIVRTGYPGTSCVVPEDYEGANCIDLVIVRPKDGRLSSHFLSRFFNSDTGKRHAFAAKTGLAQQHLNVGAVRRVRIPLPSLGEQMDITNALVSVDHKLLWHESKKSALQDLFKTTLNKLMIGYIRVQDLDIDVSEVN